MPLAGSEFAPAPGPAWAHWPDDVIQLLDDHHLVVVSDNPAAAGRFGETLTRRLRELNDTQVIAIDGRAVVDVPSFCRAIEQQLIPRRERRRMPQARVWWRDVPNVISVLREPPHVVPVPKHRYFIWQDADWLLNHDATLFARLVNALLGVAAEAEHISPETDTMVLQRSVFIASGPGGSVLERLADEPTGPFHHWLDEEGSPFWEVASVLAKPPVWVYRLEGERTGV